MEIHTDLVPGGDGFIHGVTVLNNTGPDVSYVFDTDLVQLGHLGAYRGWLGNEKILRHISLQLRLVDQHFVPWSDWVYE